MKFGITVSESVNIMGDKADVVINCIESCTNLLKLYFKKSQGSWSLTLFGNVLSFFFLAITR